MGNTINGGQVEGQEGGGTGLLIEGNNSRVDCIVRDFTAAGGIGVRTNATTQSHIDVNVTTYSFKTEWEASYNIIFTN